MFTRKILILAALLVFALSVPAFAANPWLALTNPEPYSVWESRTNSMVANTESLTVWQTGRTYMVVWDFVGVDGRVKIDLMKGATVVATLSPGGGTNVGENGKGLQEVMMSPSWVSTERYQVRVTSLSMPGISSISEPFLIIAKR